MKMKIAPSILSADFANLERDIKLVEAGGVDYIHVDVMDGEFVPNITIGPDVVAAVRKVTDLPLDVHLMIVEPERFIEKFADAGADIITVHQESTLHLHRAMQLIKQSGKKAGVVINPATPVAMIEHVLDLADLVLIMTVNPGFGGQQFISSAVSKIKELDVLRDENGYSYEVEVDGGIVPETARECKEAGANVFVAGSYIYNSENPLDRIQSLKDVIE